MILENLQSNQPASPVYFHLKEDATRSAEEEKRLREIVRFGNFTRVSMVHLIGKEARSHDYHNLWRGTKERVFGFMYSLFKEDRTHFEVCVISRQFAEMNFLECEEFLYRVENKISLSSVTHDMRERSEDND